MLPNEKLTPSVDLTRSLATVAVVLGSVATAVASEGSRLESKGLVAPKEKGVVGAAAFGGSTGCFFMDHSSLSWMGVGGAGVDGGVGRKKSGSNVWMAEACRSFIPRE